jgi:hypothetical protein
MLFQGAKFVRPFFIIRLIVIKYQMKLTDNGKRILTILIIMVVFYIFIFLLWNKTNTTHKPSGLLYDWRREGYQADPLHDKWKRK